MIGIYLVLAGIWITAVGYHGNSKDAVTFITAQKGYVSWILAIFILYMLYQVDVVKPVIKPFIFLALLALVLRNWKNIQSQLSETVSEFGL